MTVYIDEVFALNFGINYLLLRGTARLGASAAGRGRLALGALAGAVYAVAVYFPWGRWMTAAPMKILMAALMLLIAFGAKKSTLRFAAVFGALALTLCGAVYGTAFLRGRPMAWGKNLLYPVSFASLLLTALAVSLACRLLLPKLSHAPDSILPLKLELEGRTVRLSALRDSGNTLRDPVSGQGVITVYWAAAAGLFPEKLRAEEFRFPSRLALRLKRYHPRLIPYRAVGVEGGLLLAVPCRITLASEKMNGLVAFSPNPVSDGGAAEALIGGSVYVQSSGKTSAFSLSVLQNHVHRRKRHSAAPAHPVGGAEVSDPVRPGRRGGQAASH